jgi:hypothetical protein
LCRSLAGQLNQGSQAGQLIKLPKLPFSDAAPKKKISLYGPWRIRLPRKLMGLPWDRLRANYRPETLINRGAMSRKSQSGGFESLLHRHIQYAKPLISKEIRGFVVSGVWKITR